MAINHELVLIEGLKEGNKKIFAYLFQYYYSGMVFFVMKYVNEKEIAEDIVQDFFVRLWDQHENLEIESSIKAYFFSSVKNRCIDHLRHIKIKDKSTKILYEQVQTLSDERNLLIESELRIQINAAIDKLPPACREIFILNRFERLKASEIAEMKGISVRTVEGQIGKALKILKKELRIYLPTSLFLIILENL